MLTRGDARRRATACVPRSNERLETLQENTRSAQQELAWLSAALIPGTLVLVGLFLLLVGRPMRQIDRAIRELGEGDFSRPITVSGPNDIETLGRQLEWLRHRLKESTDEKNKFLRHMSHELKTPLANIREGTELLLDGSVGPARHSAAGGDEHPARQRRQAAEAHRESADVQRLANAYGGARARRSSS